MSDDDDRAPPSGGNGGADLGETRKRFPTVGIGTSAGGVRALQIFFESVPEDVEAAFVVVVHLDPEHKSELSNILASRTRMPVAQVTDRVRLESRHVYVIPPNRQLFATDHHLATAEFDEPRWQRAPIDLFFRSLAAQHGEDFAIILSGAGSDGSVGIKAVKEAGGMILVQDPDEAEYGSMPRSAVATGLADFVLPVRDIAARLPELIANRQNPPLEVLNESDGEAMQRILSHLRVRSGHDFSNYKKSTVRRRIARRMQVQRAATMAEYLTILRESQQEAQALFADLLISVTTFLRDTSAFEKLAALVIPRLFEEKGASDIIRIWVPGCATGEEAYSIAILLLEEAGRHETRCEIQVFASDLDESALMVARRPVPGRDRSRYDRGSAAQVFHSRRRSLAGHARTARHRPVRQTQSSQGSAVLARRSHLMPKRADLSRPRVAAAGLRDLPLRPEIARLSLPWLVRKRGQSSRHVPDCRP
jgi:two-component system CheB/CheR fusion protein